VTTDVFPGTDGHPEVDDISAFTEGLLAPDAAAQLREHLSGCTLCADVRTSLEEIHSALGTLPGPTAMPAELAGRIDAALAAEALLDATRPTATLPETGGGRVSRETDSAPQHTATRSDVSRETPSPRPPGHAAAATGPGRRRARARRRRTAFVTAACAVVALGIGGVLVQQSSTDDGHGRQVSAQDAHLKHHVQQLLAATKNSNSPAITQRGSSAPARRDGQTPTAPMPLAGGGPTSVPTCIREGIHRSQTPLAVDERTSYHGRPAYLVVLPHAGDPHRVDVYLVDPSCTTDSTQGPGKVLLTRTFARS
jgi:hypothetical protein